MTSEAALLITGTSRGLGKSLAEFFLNSGYFVYGCSRNITPINNKNYRHFLTDIHDDSAVASMFSEIHKFGRPLNFLINNAGVSQSSLGILTSSDTALHILRVNLIGNFLVTRAALKLMLKQQFGRIVNFSSINVPLGSAGSSIYNASKIGVEAMSKSLARECGTADITINTIGLSMVSNSGMVDKLGAKALADKNSNLLKPQMLEIEEITHAVEFFLSPLAKNITCQTIYFGGV